MRSPSELERVRLCVASLKAWLAREIQDAMDKEGKSEGDDSWLVRRLALQDVVEKIRKVSL